MFLGKSRALPELERPVLPRGVPGAGGGPTRPLLVPSGSERPPAAEGAARAQRPRAVGSRAVPRMVPKGQAARRHPAGPRESDRAAVITKRHFLQRGTLPSLEHASSLCVFLFRKKITGPLQKIQRSLEKRIKTPATGPCHLDRSPIDPPGHAFPSPRRYVGGNGDKILHKWNHTMFFSGCSASCCLHVPAHMGTFQVPLGASSLC